MPPTDLPAGGARAPRPSGVPDGTSGPSDLSRAAGRHLWSHFSAPSDLQVIERGDGWLCDLPIVVDLRGDGYFLALQLDAGSPSEPRKAQAHAVAVSKYLTRRMYALGLTCRAAARNAEPVIQLSPPLIAGPEQFDEMVDAMRVALIAAMGEVAA